MATLRRVGRWSFQIRDTVSHVRWDLVSSLIYFGNRKKNCQHIRNNVRNRIAEMDSLRREAFGLFRSRAGPIGLEVCSAEEEQCEKISNHPRGDDSNQRPVHKAKVASNAWRKDTSVEEKENSI